MAYKINVGDRIPSFNVKDAGGDDLTDEDLIGSPFVLYFYPKDDTPGCTKQACAFRDKMDDFDSIDALVIGVSPDNNSSHDTFSTKYDLNFPLIPDVDKKLCSLFDVLRDVDGNKKVERTTFVVDSVGTIQWIERPVTLEGHMERVLEALEIHCQESNI